MPSMAWDQTYLQKEMFRDSGIAIIETEYKLYNRPTNEMLAVD